MVVEFVVLFRVKHFEQSRRGVAAEVLAKLVNFVEQEQRVHCPRLFQICSNFTGH